MTIKLKDLKRIVKDYQSFFPDWKILGGDTLVRENGPVLQGILLDRSANDIYRPTGFIRVLTVPKHPHVLELPQRLRYPNGAPDRRVRLKNHERERDEIVRELRRQIVPPIDRPLVVLEVLELYEREAIPTAAEAYSLATLRAYHGYEVEARRWCLRFRELLEKIKPYWDESVYAEVDFINSMEHWLDKGEAKQQLEQVIEAERRKLGLEK